MRSFKVSVDNKKVAFFKELLDNLDFVSYQEDTSKDLSHTLSDRNDVNKKEEGGEGLSKRKQKLSDDFNSIESRKKSLEDIRKAMMNIDKLRDSL
ncbi:hypothetical protein [Plebeiibacterium sediminum]|uniref:Uncharacterized protein n=1 Tax=Plebeiibacterium sediminum TaxID=2992112 RepID=A0AAE3SFG7_9BACT|nr:hypothetical protein [Plebeiobacterium sediminum]MCW3787067.1 hypothetical protein [Plebeiobacterium sediminum]